jgi:hypothetical protein
MLGGGEREGEKFGLKADRREILGGEEKIKRKKDRNPSKKSPEYQGIFKMTSFFHSRGVLLLFFLFFPFPFIRSFWMW